MRKRVLILAPRDDFHSRAIQEILKKHGGDADIVDTADFPESASLVYFGGQNRNITLNGVNLSDYRSVWWRRVRQPNLSSKIKNSEEARFAIRESREALWGAITAAQLPIHNSPEAERIASYKPFQLKVAQDLGLSVPDTLITNSPEEVLEFRKKYNEVIYKAFGATTLLMTDTRPLTDTDLSDLWRVKHAPVIFQEYLPLAKEYRVTLVEDDIFAAEIILSNRKAHYDWRLDQNYEVVKTQLPEDLCNKLRMLRKRLQLSSGSIDLRETPDGKVYFLEINPSGQFLFLDVFGGLDVANRFCEMLLKS